MERPVKSIQVSFRLTQWQLAHGLEIIQALEPSYQPVSLSAMAKLIYQDYLAKMSIVSNPVPAIATIERIRQLGRGSNGEINLQRRTSEQELAKIMAESRARTSSGRFKTGAPSEEVKSEAEPRPRSEPEPRESLSMRSVVTDFSPPSFKDLQDEGGEEND